MVDYILISIIKWWHAYKMEIVGDHIADLIIACGERERERERERELSNKQNSLFLQGAKRIEAEYNE